MIFSLKSKGKKLVEKFVKDWLGENLTATFLNKIPKVNLKTFAAVHSIKTTSFGLGTRIKADRNLFKRLFSASASGRNVDFPQLVRHELASVSLSLPTFGRNLSGRQIYTVPHTD